MTAKRVISLCILTGFLLACGIIEASDGDLQQYSRAAANAEAANGANALTSALLLPTDGKLISADANGSGKAPVNRGLKQLADYATGIRCGIVGNCAGVNARTVASIQVDGTGGAVSSAAAGTVVASLVRGGSVLPQAATPSGVITKDSPVFGYGNVYWSGVAYSVDGGFNLDSVTRIGAGTVDVTFSTQPAAMASCATQITPYKNGGYPHFVELISYSVAAGKITARVGMRNSGGTLDDAGFTLTTHCAGS